MQLDFRTVAGPQLAAELPELSRLRLEVFREFPYLYAGDEEEERRYLRSFAATEGAIAVVARAGRKVVGMSTALPLVEAEPAFTAPFQMAGLDPGKWFYFGESVLLPGFRGRGAGRRFFVDREKRAASRGYARQCFCAVVREEGHLLRGDDYRPLDAFWRRLGYQRQADLTARLAWPQTDSAGAPVSNRLVFWTKVGTLDQM